ncbi:MAG: outer membrane protein assembly factor, partial [Bacteroidota bacterium]
DRLNYHGIYLSGWANYTLLESVYNMQYGDFFQLFINDFHYFRRIKYRGNLAARVRVGLSSNVNSPFAPFVLDSRINIRGSGNRVDRGTGTVIMNLEYRHSFLERRNLAIQGVIFSDIGVWRTPGGGWDDFVNPEYLRHFVGSGIRIIYPRAHNAMLRIDYGFGLFQGGESGLVVGFGQYF